MLDLCEYENWLDEELAYDDLSELSSTEEQHLQNYDSEMRKV